MQRYSVQSLIALILVANLSLGMAAAPAVGVVTAGGSFSIDHSSVAGNATLFEGSRIETGSASSQLQLNNGAKMQLAAESSGIVYRDRLVLERGSGRAENYGVEALSLRIRPEGGAAEVSVRNSLVEVAALNGAVRVTSANGILLANVQAGRTLAFTQAPGPATVPAPTLVTGCLEGGSGKFLLTDETSLVRFEVTGAGVSKQVGHRVQIAGTVTPMAESMSRVQTKSVTMLSKKCSARTTAAAAAGVGTPGAKPPTPSVATGAGIGSKVVIAGVVVAGAATGTALAVVSREKSPASISPSTR